MKTVPSSKEINLNGDEIVDITLAHLYPQHMNLYGDRGNVLALQYRAQKRHMGFHIINVEIGEPVDWRQVDIVFMGGGEDSHQAKIYEDFLRRKDSLSEALSQGLPMLAVCGAYQLLGHEYRTADGQILLGLGYLDVVTKAGATRSIGDVVCETVLPLTPNTLVGFENHGGQTFLGEKAKPLAHVQLGHGNNGEDGTEGALQNHVIGTYLHGSLLPKNPHLTDLFLSWALEWREGKPVELPPLDSSWEMAAHEVIVKRRNLKHV